MSNRSLHVERRDPVTHTAMVDAENDEVIPTDFFDIVLVGDREGATTEQVVVDRFIRSAAMERA